MGRPETILERTDRMLAVLGSGRPENVQDLDLLWRSGLTAPPLFAVGETRQASAEQEAEKIVSRHLKSQNDQPRSIAMAHLVEFQHRLQVRSKVISTVEILTRGEVQGAAKSPAEW